MTTQFNATSVNRQWATRAMDERFVSMDTLHAANVAHLQNSRSLVLSSKDIHAEPIKDDVTHTGLAVIGPNGHPVAPTHWAFGQLCERAAAPASYLRSLPAEMAADCVNYGLERRSIESIGVFLNRDSANNVVSLQSVNGPNYGRIHNATISEAIRNVFGNGLYPNPWRQPGEFGKLVEIDKQNCTLYRSDEDMFICLVNEDNRIEVPNRRDGKPGSLARGIMVYNSMVGKMKLGVCTFLFDFMCSNRTIWGGQDFQEISFRHTAGAPDRWLYDCIPAIESYSQEGTGSITQAIADASAKRIDDVAGFLAKRFTKTEAVGIAKAHMTDEDRPIETIWDASVAVTAYARNLAHQDARVAMERRGGEILALAA